jgi:hypothetical protein
LDLTVSPDLDAYWCYAVVFVLGLITALGQMSKRLAKLPSKWIMVNTWLLFFAYTFTPVVLFWLLDRSNAIHDTSLFAAILVGVGYQQVLSGELASIRAPGDFSKLWQPFAAWADLVADRIRNRVLRNESLFDERLLAAVRQDSTKFEKLKELALTHTKDVTVLDAELKKVTDQKDMLGDAGVLTKTAEILYDDLKLSEYETWPFLLYQQGITTRLNYYWHGKEGRSKAAAAIVALLLAGVATVALLKIWTPENRGHYYVWRLEKSNNTEQDRFRAGRQLMSCLSETRNPYPDLALLLRDDGIPIRTAENVLGLLMESREIASNHQVELPLLLVDSLRTANPDIRARVQAVLLYLADEKKADVGLLKDWKPSAKDSATDVESAIKNWKLVKWK